VKNLANQTAQATEDIAAQVAEIQNVTGTVVSAVGDIGSTIGEIDEISSTIAAAMEEQTAVTREIARNVHETADATREVTRRIAEVAGDADTTGDSAGTVRNQADDVYDSIRHLREAVVKVVRTSTSDVNRRQQPRYRIERNCRVTADGKTLPGTLLNLSEGGAMVGRVPGLFQGARGRIDIDGFTVALEFEVLRLRNDNAHMRFFLNPDSAATFHAELGRLTRGLEPVDYAA
ncbi:MAG TPA: PilZ domain-containing protein, partial [Azospirillaceae bacterium]|nr:PilZ domain-containing protein [Azospirillaceae bacterium]